MGALFVPAAPRAYSPAFSTMDDPESPPFASNVSQKLLDDPFSPLSKVNIHNH